MQSNTNDKDKRNYLQGISDMSREIVGTMSDIVWSIDNRNDTMGALILRMKDFATEIFLARNIEFEFNAKSINESILLDPVLKQNIYLIFKESVNNIIKHAQATKVTIDLINDDDEFSMSIVDNGRGVQQSVMQKGNGLRNMQRRSEAIGAKLSIQNHEGTSITILRDSI